MKLIEDQLKKVRVADLSNYDAKTNTYIIKKFGATRLKEDCCYIIELDESLLHSNQNSLLESNWNKGSIPNCKFYMADVLKEVGRMVQINGVGYDNETGTRLNTHWTGWLPVEKISVIEEI